MPFPPHNLETIQKKTFQSINYGYWSKKLLDPHCKYDKILLKFNIGGAIDHPHNYMPMSPKKTYVKNT